MGGKISDRCKRICGTVGAECFIANEKQLQCLADMVINKAYGVILCLEDIISESRDEKASESIQKARAAAGELINWVKYLQLTRDLGKTLSLTEEEANERRKETRFPLPETYRDYISFEAEVSGFLAPVSLVNFSTRGVRFISPEPIETGSVIRCRLFTRHVIKKEVAFGVEVVYCGKEDDKYVVGARVKEVADATGFDFFGSLYDFVNETRQREKVRDDK